MLKYLFALIQFLFLVECADIRVKISDSPRACDDFDNKEIDVDLNLGLPKTCGPKAMGLSGLMKIFSEIDDEHTLSLGILKDTEIGKEMMFTSEANICTSIKDEMAPWYPLVEGMKISACPIQAEDYPVSDIMLNLDCVNDMLVEDNIGIYEVELAILKLGSKISCYILGAEVYEVEEDEEGSEQEDCED